MIQTKIASYDIWDTVLRRRCHPDVIKLQVARKLMHLLDGLIKPHIRDPWLLFYLRQSIEKEIGNKMRLIGKDDEYILKDVLEAWVSRICLGPDSYSTKFIDDLIDAEIAFEKRIIYLDPDIKAQFYADGAARRIFISDFYMTKVQMFELLDHAGVATYFHDGYVSCEVGLNKRSGKLFDHVLIVEATPAKHIQHWGDNRHSDYAMPQSRGINANLYLPAAEHKDREEKEKRFAQRASLLRRSIAQFEPSNLDIGSDLQKSAASAAALFIGFVLFVQENVLAKNITHLYFFTREGEFFHRLYSILRALSPNKDLLPEGRLLEVSRLSTFGPSLQTLDVKELMRVWNLYSIQAPGALIRTIGIPVSEFLEFFSKYGLDAEVAIEYPWLDKRIIALLNDIDFRSRILERLQRNRHSFVEYCRTKGLDSSIGECTVVDIGWRGTIQDNIAYIFPDVHFSGYYLGLNKMLNEQPVNTQKFAFGPNLNKENTSLARKLLEFVAPIEMLTNSPFGSVIGYDCEEQDGYYRAKKYCEKTEDAVFHSFTKLFQDSICDIAKVYGSMLMADGIGSDEIRQDALEAWSSIIMDPAESVARAYFSLRHNETFGLGKFVDKKHELETLWPLKLLLIPGYRKVFRKKLSEIGWSQGYAKFRKDRFLIPVIDAFFLKK